MRFSRTRWLRPANQALLAAALALSSSACVSRGDYATVVHERDRLQEENRRLQLSTQSLDSDRAQALSQLEDVRQQREKLDAEVKKLSQQSSELEQSLQAREEELDQRRSQVETLQNTYEGLVKDLESEVDKSQVQIERLRGGLRLELSEDVLFPPGSADLSKKGIGVLQRVAKQLAPLPDQVQVRGHTDNQAIRGALARRFPSNWELGAARAARVVRVLEQSGISGERLVAASYGPYDPIDSNATPEGRAHNRRIEIRLLPREAPATVEPAVPLGAAAPEPAPAAPKAPAAAPPAAGRAHHPPSATP